MTYGEMEVGIHAFLTSALDWRWVVSFALWPLYLRWKSPRYPFSSRSDGFWTGWWIERNPLLLPGIERLFSSTYPSHYIDLDASDVCGCFKEGLSLSLFVP